MTREEAVESIAIKPTNGRLEEAMGVIASRVEDAQYGIFFNRNWGGDPMYNIYKKDGIEIDICKKYEYFEVFGLSEDEQRDIEKFYCALVSSWKKFRKYA